MDCRWQKATRLLPQHMSMSFVDPLVNLMQRQGVVIKVFDPDLKRGPGNVERIERLINRRTRLIFVSHITVRSDSSSGKSDCRFGAQQKILFALDGAQVAAICRSMCSGTTVIFYAAGGHKWVLGPNARACYM
jgi:selenocysteine lyase/cysteine desulfurase